jgi:hypothetical protein
MLNETRYTRGGEGLLWYADYLRLSKENYIGHKITVNPDASGNARSTSEQVIFYIKSKRFRCSSTKRKPSSNERGNAVNLAFKTTTIMLRQTCPTYSEALENQAYKWNTWQAKRIHITEVVIAYLKPIW